MKELLEQQERRLYKAIWDTIHIFPKASFDDLKAEAYWIFCEAFTTHDPLKGGFEKRLSFLLYHRLHTYASKRSTYVPLNCDYEKKSVKEFCTSLSEEASEVVSMALSIPTELNRTELRKILREKKWSNPRITKVFKEIRSSLCP